MKTIRKGMFETNSSSTHALVIDKDFKVDKQSVQNLYMDTVYGGVY